MRVSLGSCRARHAHSPPLGEANVPSRITDTSAAAARARLAGDRPARGFRTAATAGEASGGGNRGDGLPHRLTECHEHEPDPGGNQPGDHAGAGDGYRRPVEPVAADHLHERRLSIRSIPLPELTWCRRYA